MSNPHVEWLEYELKSRWGFENPPPLNWETPVFSANLNGGTLRISLKEHFPTIESARTAIEAFLQDWEIEVALTHGQREMAFVFKGSHIIDRDPHLWSEVGWKLRGAMFLRLEQFVGKVAFELATKRKGAQDASLSLSAIRLLVGKDEIDHCGFVLAYGDFFLPGLRFREDGPLNSALGQNIE